MSNQNESQILLSTICLVVPISPVKCNYDIDQVGVALLAGLRHSIMHQDVLL